MIRARPFLFGKLPAHGDFVGRGLDAAQRTGWDRRCTMALDHARARFGDAFEGALERIAPRGFLVAPSGDEPYWQAGCVAPSCDGAGRSFLFVLGVADGEGWADQGGRVAARVAPLLRMAIAGRTVADRVIAAASAESGTEDDGQAPIAIDAWVPTWLADAMATLGERID